MAWRDYATEGFKSSGMREGADIEKAVFGTPVIPPQERKSGYVPFQESVTFVKEHQPDPLKRSLFVKKLRSMVVEDCADTTVPVKFFTAVGTPLDQYHGVDAFFEQGGVLVTLDISAREKEVHKADVLLKAGMDNEGRVVIPDAELQQAAKNIAGILNQRSRLAA